MGEILLSILVGTVVYGAAQLVWYSPWGMGRLWLRSQRASAAEVMQQVPKGKQGFMSGLEALVLPGVLMSSAVVFLELLLARLGGAVFWCGIFGMWIAVALPKYRRWQHTETAVRLGWYVNDGALALSLVLIAGVTWWMI